MRRRHLRPVARILLVALAPLALDGCVSIGVSHAALEPPPGSSAPPTGALAVSVFERAGDRDAGRVARFPVLSELARVTDSGEEAVGRSMAPAWSLADLKPGKYRLRVTRRLTAEGDIEALEKPGDKTFEISAGLKTTVSVVLKKVPVFWIVVAALTVVALVILAIAGSKHGHLPPPPPLPLPPVFVVIPLDGYGESGMPAPGAADVFPAKGSVVSARRVTVTFLLSAPLAPDGVGENAVLALGTTSGEIAGTVSYLERDGLLRFAPSRDFAPGETVTVTLDLSKLRGAGGREGSGKVSTSFLVPVVREQVLRLLSVNVGLPRTVTLMRRTINTAFFKEPVSGAIPLTRLGLRGDGQADPKYHGGPDKAVYLYPFEHYAYWSAVLGRADLSPGAFGENFTTEGLLETETRVGDVFAIGSAKLRVTQPRTPCAKLGLRMGSMPFVRVFAASGRPGFYLSVVEEGSVEKGDAITRIATDPKSPTVAEVFGGS